MRRRCGVNNQTKNGLLYVLVILLGVSASIGGYRYAKREIQTMVSGFQQTYDGHIESLNQQIEATRTDIEKLSADVGALNIELETYNEGLEEMLSHLEQIDTNIIGSEEVQLEISAYLDELDERLSELRQSLKTLEVAPDESN
jgi:chromosome segregation ATPase